MNIQLLFTRRTVSFVVTILFSVSVLVLSSCNNKSTTEIIDTVAVVNTPARIVALGRVEPENKIVKLSSDASGIISLVRVQAGDSVRKGDVIIELAHPVEDAQIQVNNAQAGTRRAELQTLNASLESAKIKSENLKGRFDRIKNSVEKGADTKQNLDNISSDYQASLKEIERIEASINTAQRQVVEVSTQASLSQAQRSRKFITAPSNGRILTMDLAPGAAVQAMGGVCDFAPEGPVSVLCEVDELFAEQVKVGQQVSVRMQGQTDIVAKGEVIFTAPFLKRKSLFSDGGDMEDRRVREIRIRLSDGGALLFGARVECVIE